MKKAALLVGLAIALAAIVVAPAFGGSPNGRTVTETQHIHGAFDEPAATSSIT